MFLITISQLYKETGLPEMTLTHKYTGETLVAPSVMLSEVDSDSLNVSATIT